MNTSDDAWWELNEMAFWRELQYITSKHEASRAIYHARHHDDYYIRRLGYELGEWSK